MPNKTSSGHDEINNILLKQIKESIVAPLATIFNESLTNGIFPETMKLAEVVPLYKGKAKNEKANYRPISLLLTVSKILEKIMYARTYSFLIETNQLYQSQYGFRKRHSCEHAIGELVSEVAKNIENMKFTVTIYLDLSKAFDTLEHSTLISKLELYGIRGVTLKWYREYLDSRKLLVKCSTKLNSPPTKSDTHDIEYDTAQGSCLGPLLFLIFCNDMHLNLMFLHCLQFADDTTLYLGHVDIRYLEFCVEHDLLVLQDWFRANKLTLNIDKSCCMLFTPKPGNKKYQTKIKEFRANLGDITIPNVVCTKFLGIWIDKDLNWKTQYDKLVLKLKSKLILMYRGKNFLSIEAKKQIYYAQVHSNLIYGLVIWGNMLTNTEILKLEKIQKKGIQAINPRMTVDQIRNLHGILLLLQLTRLENCKIWQKHRAGLLPVHLQNLMTIDNHQRDLTKRHRYNTRRYTRLNIPRAMNKKYRQSFLVQGLSDYDKLPNDIKQEEQLHKFVKQSKKHITQMF